jgi:hypothetical protein
MPFVLAVLAAAQKPSFQGGVHEDPVIGFKIKVPDKWTFVPVDIDEKWIVAKYNCHREYAGKTAYVMYRPRLQVVHFTPEKAKVKERTETRGDTTYTSKVAAFRNYLEWFKELMKGGVGFHVESEKQDKIGDVPVTKLEILTDQGGDGALRFLVWIYQRPDESTVAVEFSQLEDYYKNLEGDFMKSLRSFRFIEPVADASASEHDLLENPMWTFDRAKWRELPKTERWKIRQSMDTKRRELVLADVPDGWKVQESRSKRFTAISHVDPKYTTLVLDTADATWDWLDKRFGDLSDEYVMAGTIRICKDMDEARAYGISSADWDSFSFDDREIVEWKERDAGTSGGGQTWLMNSLLQAYLLDKDSYAQGYAPSWIILGLGFYLASGELEGRRLSFKSDTYERIFLREAEREGALRTFNEIITTVSDDWPKEWRPFYRYAYQLSSLVRFLESREASRMKFLDDFIPRYAAAVVKAGEQWKKDHPATAQAKTEEEEEARAKNRAKARREREKFVIDYVNKEIANFSQKEWQQLEAAWKKWLTR